MDLLNFLISNNLHFRCIWYYIQASDGKKIPVGEKNNITIEDALATRWKNRSEPEWAVSSPRFKNTTTEEWSTRVPAYSIYLKHISNLYVIDVDVKGINSMADFVSQTGIRHFENSSWIKGNTKGIHIYVYIENMIQFSDQQGVYNDFDGDLLKVNNVWEGRKKTVEGEKIETVQWDQIKDIFNIEKMTNTKENPKPKASTKKVVKEKAAQLENTVVNTETEIEPALKDMIYEVFKNDYEIIEMRDYLIISTVMVHTGFTIEEWRDWHGNKNDDHIWKGIKKGQDGYDQWRKILEKMAVRLFPERLKEWDKKHGFKQPISTKTAEDKPAKYWFEVNQKFEETHCKIINKAFFVKKTEDNSILLMTPAHMNHAYSNMSYIDMVPNKEGDIVEKKKPFLKRWLSIDHEAKSYQDIGIYPKKALCPETIFNMWIPFTGETMLGDIEKGKEGRDSLLKHIHILCNNDKAVSDYFEKWIAQMFQYPEVKTICPTLISEEGSGKGTLLTLLQKMMGKGKVFITTNPSRDVWGSFNPLMADCFLVNLNELSLKDTVEAMSVIKGLITDDTLTINNKGISPYEISSYHRFIATTNNLEPFTSKNGDRRNLIIQSSDEKKGDIPYFTQLQKYLADDNVIKACYEYFMSIPDMDKFALIPMPITEYQAALKEGNRSHLDQFFEAFTREHFQEKEIELLSKEIYSNFYKWSKEMKIEHTMSAIKMGKALSTCKSAGLKKGKHTNKGNTWILDIAEFKKEFGLGNLVLWNGGETEGETDEEEIIEA
jgi:hypothetical protein